MIICLSKVSPFWILEPFLYRLSYPFSFPVYILAHALLFAMAALPAFCYKKKSSLIFSPLCYQKLGILLAAILYLDFSLRSRKTELPLDSTVSIEPPHTSEPIGIQLNKSQLSFSSLPSLKPVYTTYTKKKPRRCMYSLVAVP